MSKLLKLLRKMLEVEVPVVQSPEQRSIELLERQLSMVNEEKKQLLELLMAKKEESVPSAPPTDFQAIMPKQVPWHVRQRMLEAEDREKAKLMKASDEEQRKINELEKELEIAPKSVTQ